MTDSRDEYIKQLEVENAKLRENFEKMDRGIAEIIRTKLKVSVTKDRAIFTVKNADPLTPEELKILQSFDINFVSGGLYPDLVTNDIVSVQPMMSPVGNVFSVNYVTNNPATISPVRNTPMTPANANKRSYPSNSIDDFSKIIMPMITGKHLDTESIEESIQRIAEKIKEED